MFRKIKDFLLGYAIYQWQLKRNEFKTRDQIEKIQREKLVNLVNYTVQNSPFFNRMYGTITQNKNWKLTDLPITNKKILIDNFDNYVTDRAIKLTELEDFFKHTGKESILYCGKYHVIASSGTGGAPIYCLYNKKEWRMALAGILRWSSLMNFSSISLPRKKIFTIHGNYLPMASYQLTNAFDMGLTNKKTRSTFDDFQVICQEIDNFKPDILSTYPSFANLLAVAQLEKKIDIKPQTVITTSEFLSDSHIKNIKDAWGQIPFNHYSMTECLGLSSDCEKHDGIHLYEDLGIIEVVDDNYQSIKPGCQGTKVLLTNLYNYTQPIIRYEIDDMVTISDKYCSCGRKFLLIKNIYGRDRYNLVMPKNDGSTIKFQFIFFQMIFAIFPEIVDYKILFKNSILNLQLVINKSPLADFIRKEIEEKLNAKFLEMGILAPKIIISFLKQLDRQGGSGKLKVIEVD